MAQLSLDLGEKDLEALRQYAAERRVDVSSLIKDYVEYLLAGGTPLTPGDDGVLSAAELATLAERGGSFDWLANEPDLYTLADGEPV
jgi:hypothetical protein